jgi:hypothetical protein
VIVGSGSRLGRGERDGRGGIVGTTVGVAVALALAQGVAVALGVGVGGAVGTIVGVLIGVLIGGDPVEPAGLTLQASSSTMVARARPNGPRMTNPLFSIGR